VKEPLLSLASDELRQLAGALEAGRLTPPYSAVGLQRFVSHSLAAGVAGSLIELTQKGCGPQAIARVMDLLAAAAAQRPPLEDMVHLVATGPDEAEGAPRATGVVVSDLFRGAEKSVIVVGYAVHQGQRVFKDLADRMAQHPGLQVRLCLDIQRKDGDTSIPEEIVRRFSERFQSTQWPVHRPFPEVYYDTRSVSLERRKAGVLHAKCVVVDAQRLFISSANFTEAAQERNIEIGLLLDSCVLARRMTDFIERLIQADLLKRLL
jgi:phosphatidylserine/phosphatidylglycerophosphate/cardiolipin synthase-like enzyme